MMVKVHVRAKVRLCHDPVVLVANWNTWGVLVNAVERVNLGPETTRTSPFGSTVTLGYKRPAIMSGKRVQTFWKGS